MTDILSRINATLDGLCPCGGTPRPGSPYCSYDCEPTHLAADTDTTGPGGSSRHGVATPMRWRPDLVNEADDTRLIRVNGPGGEPHGYTGRYNASVHRYADRAGVWHLRLDNGHRYVGGDITEGELFDAPDFTALMRDRWVRLERELGNTWHTEPDGGPWADAFPHQMLEAAARRPILAGQLVTMDDFQALARQPILTDAEDAVQRMLAAAGMPVVMDRQHMLRNLGMV